MSSRLLPPGAGAVAPLSPPVSAVPATGLQHQPASIDRLPEPLADPRAFTEHLARARAVEWVVYAKRPFAGPRQVVDYVGRYTHRVAIANDRLVDLTNDHVRFRWKDYRAESRVHTMTLAATEFIRRFLLHVLPAGFQRIRYYGLLGNRHREKKLARCRALLGMPTPSPDRSVASGTGDYRDRLEALTGVSLRVCPICREGQMVAVIVDPRVWAAPAIVNTS